MPYVAIASLALSAYGQAQQNSAAKTSEQLARDTAQRNANVDFAQADQLKLDTDQNIQQDRQEAAIYTSHQQTAYASSGVLADSGSPLAVQVSTVGKLQQRIQQEYISAGQREQQMVSAGQAGIAYGDASARATNIENTAAQLKGGINMLSTAYGDYKSGMFSGSGTPATASGYKGFEY